MAANNFEKRHIDYPHKGSWATSTAYALHDTVESNGSGYICTSAHTSGSTTEPGVGASWTDKWDLFVEGLPEPNLTTATTTNLTGYLYGDGTNIASKGTIDGWIPAGETWTYASADDPTFTFTVAADVTTKYSAGMKIKLTQGTVKYFIITAVSTYSGGNTTITVYGGTDYDLANSAISANAYSMMKSPQGFPMSPDKWSVVVTPNNFSQAGATSAAWYEATNISLPIGSWDFGCSAMGYISRTSGTAGAYNIIELLISETTANNAPYQLMYSYSADRIPVPSTLEIYVMQRSAYFRSIIITTAKKSFYLNLSCTFAGVNTIGATNMRLSAVCAYL